VRFTDLTRRWSRAGVVALVAALVVPAIVAWHYARLGWRDQHHNYPSRPTSYTQIVNRFGQPCSDAAHAVSLQWTAADTGETYTVRFHRKLGGYPTSMVADEGGRSTNLDNDVYGHIQNEHLQPYIEHGIYGYACRYIRGGSNDWSTHAFGIAIDVSSAEEYLGRCSSSVNRYHRRIWEDHGWYWGLAFCDPMHFQYAINH
jgi:D-alanyl-D-alanine carboxypeptidase